MPEKNLLTQINIYYSKRLS